MIELLSVSKQRGAAEERGASAKRSGAAGVAARRQALGAWGRGPQGARYSMPGSAGVTGGGENGRVGKTAGVRLRGCGVRENARGRVIAL